MMRDDMPTSSAVARTNVPSAKTIVPALTAEDRLDRRAFPDGERARERSLESRIGRSARPSQSAATNATPRVRPVPQIVIRGALQAAIKTPTEKTIVKNTPFNFGPILFRNAKPTATVPSVTAQPSAAERGSLVSVKLMDDFGGPIVANKSDDSDTSERSGPKSCDEGVSSRLHNDTL